MDPSSGRVIALDDLEQLRRTDPTEAAKFSVELTGAVEDIERISRAVKREANRRKNKAARKARRVSR